MQSALAGESGATQTALSGGNSITRHVTPEAVFAERK